MWRFRFIVGSDCDLNERIVLYQMDARKLMKRKVGKGLTRGVDAGNVILFIEIKLHCIEGVVRWFYDASHCNGVGIKVHLCVF
jgi:hypothetical protein